MAVSENPPTIIITGSSRGLGAAIVDYLLDNSNANLVLNSRSPSGHKSPRTVHLCADMGHEGTGKKLVELAIEKFGRLDAVVVNHGVVDPVARLEEADVKDWKDSFEINVFGVVELVKAAIPALRSENGRMIFVSSGAAVTPYIGFGAYGAAKAVLNHLNLTLAAEVKDITSLSIRPGVIDTQMQVDVRERHRGAMGDGNERFQELYRSGKLLPAYKPGGCIARLALFADKNLSGKFLSWDAKELEYYQG